MPLNLASPGLVVREVDLTIGRATPSSDKIGAIVSPFVKGPVESPILVENENDLLDSFGKPHDVDKNYEHWLSAASYLAYGGALRVVRCDNAELTNGFVGSASSIKIKSLEHYTELGYNDNTIPNVQFAARNPGSWSNDIRVAIIDGKADQRVYISDTTNITVGMGVTQAVDGRVAAGAGTTTLLTGYLRGIITEVDSAYLGVKVLSHVPNGGTETERDYSPNSVYEFKSSQDITVRNSALTGIATESVTSTLDWFDQQTITLNASSTVKWNALSNRPTTTQYAAARGSRFDELHVVIIDAQGSITGNAGTILEKHLGLSKGTDAQYSVGSTSYWRKYLANSSNYVFAGTSPTGIVTTGFSSGFTLETDVAWDQEVSNITFAGGGANNYTLAGGKNYDGTSTLTTGSLQATLADLSSGYDLFENTDNFKVDFLLMGSAGYGKETAQALANKLISVAELRKDAIAFISPYRGSAITDTSVQSEVTIRSAADITTNVVSFYSAVTSSSYAVFDSGYKYMYDRFSNTFRYVPLNGDIAGTCARNDINNFPWYSPAGTSRGAILNAVKLAYNPSKAQRDTLYSNRINPVIFSPGSGIVLFGDKTGFAKASAFDRVNVRRLFIYLEEAISRAAKDQLFEFNDSLTRTNFVNTIEPFLRDVQAKRGIFDYVVICDETNNTAAVIDNNEFIADIYIKPARSINFIGLNFVATRTGVAFEEVIGNF